MAEAQRAEAEIPSIFPIVTSPHAHAHVQQACNWTCGVTMLPELTRVVFRILVKYDEID